MKINVPVVERDLAGFRYTYPGHETIYFAEDRPNELALNPRQDPVYDLVLRYRTVFDYDFKAAARLRATAAAAALSGLLVAGLVAVPVISAWLIGRDLVKSVVSTTREAADAAMWVVRYVGAGIVTAAGAIVNP